MALVAAYSSSESEDESKEVVAPPPKRVRRKPQLLNPDEAFASTDMKFLRESEKKAEEDNQAKRLQSHDHVPAAVAGDDKSSAKKGESHEGDAASSYGVPDAAWHVPLTFVDLVRMEKERAIKQKTKKKKQGGEKKGGGDDDTHQPRQKRSRQKDNAADE